MMWAILGVLVGILVFVMALYGAVAGEIRRREAMRDYHPKMGPPRR